MGVVLRSLARSPTSSSRPTSCLPPRLVSLRHTCRAVSREAVEAAGDKGKGGGKCVVVVESPAKVGRLRKVFLRMEVEQERSEMERQGITTDVF